MAYYNGQSKSEFEKNYKRINDILSKSEDDIDKAISIAKVQSTRITNEFKSINRAMAAKEIGHSFKLNNLDDKANICQSIYDVFFRRAYELGSVSTKDYREYQLEKLGL